jgi:hypothetical protein
VMLSVADCVLRLHHHQCGEKRSGNGSCRISLRMGTSINRSTEIDAGKQILIARGLTSVLPLFTYFLKLS